MKAEVTADPKPSVPPVINAVPLTALGLPEPAEPAVLKRQHGTGGVLRVPHEDHIARPGHFDAVVGMTV
jgi:hypothetical protein